MQRKVSVGVIGDYNADYPSHIATNEAINRAGRMLGFSVEAAWLPTKSLEARTAHLQPFDALWCSPGSPYQSMAGALQAIRFAREQDYPFLGT
jgi:CTP synthase (UTP-ammonia lyase)